MVGAAAGAGELPYSGSVIRHHDAFADAVVIGAGAAGLASAAALQRMGLQPVILDRADTVGSAWRTRYDSFRLHTVRWLSGLPGLRIPPRFGSWVARDDFVRYLQGYATFHRLAPRLGVELHGLARDGTGWRLDTSDGPLHTSRVVLATGACNTPLIPDWPGRNHFCVPMVHSSEYRSPAEYRGARVLVVGSGNSATEIAVDLAAAGVSVELAVRTPPAIVRRDTHGVPSQLFSIGLRRAPAVLMNPLGAALRRLTVPDLAPFGLPAPADPFSQYARTATTPVLDHGFAAAVQSGQVVIRPGVTALHGDRVEHADGSLSTPDRVISATGYAPGLEPLLGPLDLLDERGLPRIGAPGLHTVGIEIPLSGLLREIRLDSRALVRTVAAQRRS